MALTDWALVLSAVATLTLAGAAFWSIIDNRHIRLKDRDLEFKRRSIGEIIQWVRALREAVHEPSEIKAFMLSNRRVRLQSLQLEGHNMATVASIFGHEFQAQVERVQENLAEFVGMLPTLLEELPPEHGKAVRELVDKAIPQSVHKGLFDDEESVSKYREQFKLLILSTVEILEAAFSIKNELKL